MYVCTKDWYSTIAGIKGVCASKDDFFKIERRQEIGYFIESMKTAEIFKISMVDFNEHFREATIDEINAHIQQMENKKMATSVDGKQKIGYFRRWKTKNWLLTYGISWISRYYEQGGRGYSQTKSCRG